MPLKVKNKSNPDLDQYRTLALTLGVFTGIYLLGSFIYQLLPMVIPVAEIPSGNLPEDSFEGFHIWIFRAATILGITGLIAPFALLKVYQPTFAQFLIGFTSITLLHSISLLAVLDIFITGTDTLLRSNMTMISIISGAIVGFGIAFQLYYCTKKAN